jgi:hypothetical protein
VSSGRTFEHIAFERAGPNSSKMATCRPQRRWRRSVLHEGVLDLLAGLREVAHGLVALAFTFHLLVVGRFARFSLAAPLASSFLFFSTSSQPIIGLRSRLLREQRVGAGSDLSSLPASSDLC